MLHVPRTRSAPRMPDRPSHCSPRSRSELRSSNFSKKSLNSYDRLVPRGSADLVVLDFLEQLGTPRALAAWMLYRYDEHRQLVELSLDPHAYSRLPVGIFSYEAIQCGPLGRFFDDYAATKFLSKCSGLSTGIDTEAVAIKSAEEAELRNRTTNESIRAIRSGRASDLLGSEFFRAQQIIAKILGPLPSSFDDVGWSSGRTTSAFGDEVDPVHKYSASADITTPALSQARNLIRQSPLWGAAVLNADGPVSILSQGLTIVEGNVMLVVPKNAKTDRTICYEPHMNIRLQLNTGGFIRRRLLKAGVNLNDQSINQRRAVMGSRFGHLATIDLRSASDTVSLELVYDLLPVDWAVHLDSLRSKMTLWKDGWRKNEKFSSMGNGFTFELESLIFYGLSLAVSTNVSVYGDDIIVPSDSFPPVTRVLRAAGFELNNLKSFASSEFRESCGTDAFGGDICTPPYLRQIPKRRSDIIKLHNQIRNYAARRAHFPHGDWAILLRKWRDIFPCVSGPGKTSTGESLSDGHYHVNFSEACPIRAGSGLDGWWFESFVFSDLDPLTGSSRRSSFSDGLAFAALCAATGPRRLRTIWDSRKGRVCGAKKRRGLASFTWPDVEWSF